MMTDAKKLHCARERHGESDKEGQMLFSQTALRPLFFFLVVTQRTCKDLYMNTSRLREAMCLNPGIFCEKDRKQV